MFINGKNITSNDFRYAISEDIKNIYVNALTIDVYDVSEEEKKSIKDVLNLLSVSELRNLYIDGLNFGMDRIQRKILNAINKLSNE